MRIHGFGDSFITENDLDYSYNNTVQQHFNAEGYWYGKPGSGAWDAFFTFLDMKIQSDVIIFVWSAEHRYYHPNYSDICPVVIEQNLNSNDPTWLAAKLYYQHLYDSRKSYFEHVAFYQYVDDYLATHYKDTKIIHMWGFPAGNTYTHNGEYINPIQYNWDEPEQFKYIYRFKNGVELRPALINLSYRDGWPGDLRNETRCHHMTPMMHQHLSKYVIDAIENYSAGRLIKIS